MLIGDACNHAYWYRWRNIWPALSHIGLHFVVPGRAVTPGCAAPGYVACTELQSHRPKAALCRTLQRRHTNLRHTAQGLVACAESHRATPCHTRLCLLKLVISVFAVVSCASHFALLHMAMPPLLNHTRPCRVTLGHPMSHLAASSHMLFTNMVNITLVRILYLGSLNLVRILVHRLVVHRFAVHSSPIITARYFC